MYLDLQFPQKIAKNQSKLHLYSDNDKWNRTILLQGAFLFLFIMACGFSFSKKELDKRGIAPYNRFTMLKRTFQQGGRDYGDHLHSKGGLLLSQPGHRPGRSSGCREVWSDAPAVFERESARGLWSALNRGQADAAPVGDQRYGLCADRPHGQAVAENLSRAGQIGGPSGLCRPYEQSDRDGGRDGVA